VGQKEQVLAVSENKDFLKELALACLPAFISALPELIRAVRNQPHSDSGDHKHNESGEESHEDSFRSFVRRSSSGR